MYFMTIMSLSNISNSQSAECLFICKELQTVKLSVSHEGTDCMNRRSESQNLCGVKANVK